jgi:phospholipid/cholesterol/gamma-HCH transport system ATP-binding protein
MSETIISYRNVTKAFGSNRIYRDITLDIHRGETICVIGGSGTGKSVMMKMLVGLLEPDAGDIEFFGQSIVGLKQHQWLDIRRRVAMLFQGGALFDSLTVGANIQYPMIEHKWGDKSKREKRVTEVLEMVGLGKIEHLYPAEISGGMKKRVALARAIAVEPEVLLYDEPTTGLDPISIRRINGLIRNLQERLNVTSMVVTHEMPSVFTIADRIAMLHDQQIAFVGTPEEAKAITEPWLADFIIGGEGVLNEKKT